MPFRKLLLLLPLVFCLFPGRSLYAQYPAYFTYDDRNGLPSNEVYCLAQDPKGMIWLGCDAGLYKYNGVRYIRYNSISQKSKSITGLTFSSSGQLYCYNFQGQIFYVERDTLKEIPHSFSSVISMTAGDSGRIFLAHPGGVALYQEKLKSWTAITGDPSFRNNTAFRFISKTPRSLTQSDKLYFIYPEHLGQYEHSTITSFPTPLLKGRLISLFHPEHHQNDLWIFITGENYVLRLSNGRLEEVRSKNLLEAIHNRKITGIRSPGDGYLWICTYKGMIRYRPDVDEAKVYYPELSFSDCLYDREGNYWFSTLYSGMIRVADLSLTVWNQQNSGNNIDRIVKLTENEQDIFFATINGTIGRLEIKTEQLTTYHTGIDADVQSLNFDRIRQALVFHMNNRLFYLKDGKIGKLPSALPAIKDVYHMASHEFFASSHGTSVRSDSGSRVLFPTWSREICADPDGKRIWIPTNKGLHCLEYRDNQWIETFVFQPEVQFISLDFDPERQTLYALTFRGEIFGSQKKGSFNYLGELPEKVQAYKIRHDRSGKLHLATNQGLYSFYLKEKIWEVRNVLSGLASNYLSDLTVAGQNLWLASGNGLQKVPLGNVVEKPKVRLYITSILIDSLRLDPGKEIHLQHRQILRLFPEVSAYQSEGNFQYAYRLREHASEWTFLPATIEHLDISNIPPGDFVLEIKVVDHLGRDSESTVLVAGSMHPPFWKTWWFRMVILVLFLLLVYIIYQIQVRRLKQKTNLLNEVNKSRLTAIQSQMNPHFIFNSLNSIQDLILKGDIENSYTYIATFSNLVRKTLHFSDKDFVAFEDEINSLELYLSLEKLRFKKQFEYHILTNGVEDVFLPPLLIQPFIENSLIHGLLHREGLRLLNISFHLEEHLICVIEDNGIGREKSRLIRQRQYADHESFSGHAIHRRFEIFSRQYHQEFGYHYEDLENEQGEASGTRVILTIPVKRDF